MAGQVSPCSNSGCSSIPLTSEPLDSHDQPPDQREGARPQVEVGEVSSFCSYFTPIASAGPAAIHVKLRRLSRVLGPARCEVLQVRGCSRADTRLGTGA